MKHENYFILFYVILRTEAVILLFQFVIERQGAMSARSVSIEIHSLWLIRLEPLTGRDTHCSLL